MPPKLFSFTQFRKNASAAPFVSHTFKTKDLKPFRFIHFQKKGWGRGPGHRCPARKWVPLSNLQAHTSNLGSSLSALDSALTSKRASKSFRSNTYEKHTQGEGGWLPTLPLPPLPPLLPRLPAPPIPLPPQPLRRQYDFPELLPPFQY